MGTFLILMTIYVMISSLIKAKSLTFMHESSSAIILGFIFALAVILLVKDSAKVLDYFRFDETLFFTAILPFIVFSAGFNMR